VVTARTHPRLLGHKATLDATGEPRVDGRVWTAASVNADVEQIVGRGARLVRDETAKRFDILPLLVATDGAISAFGYDGRRLRPNLVIGGVSGLEERRWPGRCLQIGDVVIRLRDLRGRCVMTTFDPETLTQDPRVLTSILERLGGKLALNATTLQEGGIAAGDSVQLMSTDDCRGEGGDARS
jgi:MOSC domain-containing protein